MLVIDAEQRQVRIVLHTDLARLTAQLAAWWGNARFAPLTPAIPMVIAAQEHAAGWRAWEMKPYLDLDGRPIDAVRGARYLGPHWIDLYVEGVAALAERDAYAAVMASLHWETLLGRVREAWPPGLAAAIAEQQLLREHLIEALWEEGAYRLETDAAHLAPNQAALDTLDQLATWLVSGQPGAGGDQARVVRAPLGPGRGAVDLRLRWSRAAEAVIEPYPFGVEPLQVSCGMRTLADRNYASQGEFVAQFYRAPLTYPTYTLVSRPR